MKQPACRRAPDFFVRHASSHDSMLHARCPRAASSVSVVVIVVVVVVRGVQLVVRRRAVPRGQARGRRRGAQRPAPPAGGPGPFALGGGRDDVRGGFFEPAEILLINLRAVVAVRAAPVVAVVVGTVVGIVRVLVAAFLLPLLLFVLLFVLLRNVIGNR